MGVQDSNRYVIPGAVTAVQAIAGVDEETAVDVVDALRVYFDMAYLVHISVLERRLAALTPPSIEPGSR